MSKVDTTRLVRDVADLRIQVNALEVTAKNDSLPASMKETRSTMRWSALAISAALILSSALKFCGDHRVEVLEKRVEALEKYHAPPASP